MFHCALENKTAVQIKILTLGFWDLETGNWNVYISPPTVCKTIHTQHSSVSNFCQIHSCLTAQIVLKANKQRLWSFGSKPSVGYLSRTECVVSILNLCHREGFYKNPKTVADVADGSLAQHLKAESGGLFFFFPKCWLYCHLLAGTFSVYV